MESILRHPYYPQDLTLQNFLPNENDLSSVAGSFVAMWVIFLASAWYLSSLISPNLCTKDKSIVLWFTMCGTLHCFFEGYFILNHATLGASQSLFAQLWKEYSLSDSRYLTGDPTVLCAEAITVFVWGPLCYITAMLILGSSPYRHSAQAMVSLAHLYGDALYISTSLVNLYVRQVSYSRPELYYFWFYFLFLNSIWIFVPAGLLYQSTIAVGSAFLECQKIHILKKDKNAEEITSQHMKGRRLLLDGQSS